MMGLTNKKKSKTIILEILFALFILLIFYFILFRYFGITPKIEKENPRFVKIDYPQLRIEAESIGNPSELINENAKNVFVLTYHVVSKDPPKDEYELSYDQFKQNMFALKSQGYQTVSLDDLYLFLGGEKNLPDKSFVLTFDDAAKTAYYNVDPILEALDYNAVMFVITGHSLEGVESPYYMNESELIAAEQTGRWEIQSHTHESHYRLPIASTGEIAPALTNKLWIGEENRLETDEEFFARISNDLNKAKDLLENKFSRPVIAFALPFGDFGERGSNYAEANNIVHDLTADTYNLVFYEFPLKNRLYKGNYQGIKQDSYLVARFAADSFRTPDKLLQRIQSSRALKLPYYESYTNYDLWPRLSGGASFEENSIVLRKGANSSDDAVFAYLDGSYLWKDYTYSLQLKNLEASSVFLIFRLTKGGDYTACKYGNGLVRIIEVKKNIQIIIKEGNLPKDLFYRTDLSMTVLGTHVRCMMDGKEVLSAEVPNMPAYGGVGIKAEGFGGENATFAFGNIEVREENS